MKFPRYPKRPHQSGAARIHLNGKDYYLGKFGSPESYQEYARLQAMAASGEIVPTTRDHGPMTIKSLVAAWLAQATNTKRKELTAIKSALTPLVRLFGKLPASEFTVRHLKLVRQAFVDGSWMNAEERAKRKANGKPIGWCRRYANKGTQKVRRLFRWGEEEGHVPHGIWAHLGTLKALGYGSGAREVADRAAANYERQVKPALPFMSPVVAAMVQVQHLIGARPSEVCRMRRCEIDQASVEGVWLFRPGTHKNAWRGDDLVKVIGPQAQIILAPWLMAAEPEGYVFPPTKQRYKRGHYDSEGYGRATSRAIKLAGVEHWTPYQLRHAAAQRAESIAGIAGAAAHLGHRNLETTKDYLAKQNLAMAIDVAKKSG